jgi:hypothetical protein
MLLSQAEVILGKHSKIGRGTDIEEVWLKRLCYYMNEKKNSFHSAKKG